MYNKEDIMNLAYYCQKGSENLVEKFIDDIDYKLDLTAEDGEVLSQAITGKSTRIVSMLLDYYNKENLNDDYESVKYKAAKHKLQVIIDEILDSYCISPEIEALLDSKGLINSCDDSDVDSDLDSSESFYSIDHHEAYNTSALTEENIEKLNAKYLGEVRYSQDTIETNIEY